ncbi:MAG: hypothetical protein DHS20C18_56150 [Saprospiraceae bacterium]|nr:MAG: hypothetical protein DHS20C18_56150 [Saprospiraceae bacterium]
MSTLNTKLRKLFPMLTLLFLTTFYNQAFADICSISNVRTGGQSGDAYIGPTCDSDGTYRTCFYISGLDLPTTSAGYQVSINGVSYLIAFFVLLNPQLAVICVTNVTSHGILNDNLNSQVFIQLSGGCTYLASNLYIEPVCPDLTVCTITNVRLGGQPGDAYIGPTCNGDGTYRTCFYISGQALPANNPAYQIMINGVAYPIAFTVSLSSQLVVACVTDVSADGTPNVSVTVQLATGCSYLASSLFTEPVCPDLTVCDITAVRLGGQPGDAFIGPTCNGDGTYRTCFYISGQALPANNPAYQLIIDGVSYPIAFTTAISSNEVVVCANGIPANGTQGVSVYVQLADGCDFQACPLYNEPASCPGGTFPPDPGAWMQTSISGAGGSTNFDTCDPDDFTISATGLPSPTSDKQQLIYQDICGDSELIARVSSISNSGWAGIEMRENLTPGSKKATLKTQLSNFVRREVRTTQNGFAQSAQLFRPQATWLRLVRSGNDFHGYTSQDGVNWLFAFSTNITMNSCIKVGLFAHGINANTLVTTVFDNVSISGGAPVMPGVLNQLAVQTPEYPPVQLSADFDLYPNPAMDVVNIELTSFLGQQVNIGLYSIEGRLLKNQTIDEVANATEQVTLQGLANGTYLVKINSQEASLTKKLVVSGRE